MNGMLTAGGITQALLDAERQDEWLKHFEQREFDKLEAGKGLGLVPFKTAHLGPVSYDLTVGDQVYSLRRAKKRPLTREDDVVTIDAGETVLILTSEFLALSPQYAGVTLSRARIMNEGIALSSAKVDPTWHGKLVIPITNISRSQFQLRRGDRFCTILLFRLEKSIEPEKYLTQENTPHLGQRTFEYAPRHSASWDARRPEAVCEDDIDRIVEFGPPFDVVRGMFTLAQQNIVDYMEKTWSPKIIQDLRHSAWEEEFQQIKAYRQEEIKLLQQQVDILRGQGRWQLGLVMTLLLAVLAWIGTAVAVIIKFGASASAG